MFMLKPNDHRYGEIAIARRGGSSGASGMPETGDVEVKTAILSVADKSGLVDFAKGLRSFGVSLLATGGTYNALHEAGVEVKGLGEAMGLSEALSGRVKTL